MVATIPSKGGRYHAQPLSQVSPWLGCGLLDSGAFLPTATICLASPANRVVDGVDDPGHWPSSLVMLCRPRMIPGAASPVATPAP